MQSQVTTKRIGLNIASQWALSITNIVINFFLIGYVIAKVGAEHYGGWTAIVSIIGYLSMLDVGLSVAIQHYVARFSASGEKNRMVSLFSSAYVVYGFSAVAAALLCFGASLVYPAIFPKVPTEAAIECVVSLRWVSVAMLIFILNLPVRGALLGLQRHYVRNTIEFSSLLVRAGTVLVSFGMFGPSLAYLGMAFFAAALVRFVLSRAALRLIEPNLCFRLSFVTRSSLRDVFSYGGHSFFWTIATVVVRDSGPILATILISPAAATYLYVGTRLVRSLGTFMSGAGQVFVPVASALQATDDNVRLRAALVRGTRFCALFAFSAAAMLLIFGRMALYHWVGFNDDTAYYIVVVTTIGMLGSWVFTVAQSILMGARILWPLTGMLMFRLVSCVVLGTIMGYYLSVTGLAMGLTIPILITSSTLVPHLACRHTDIRIGNLLRESLPGPLVVGSMVAMGAWMIQHVWPPESVWILMAQCAAVLVLFLIIAVVLGLDTASRKLILAKISTNLLMRKRHMSKINQSRPR